MPLFRRVAKRGFSNAAFSDEIVIINLDQLDAKFTDGQDVDVQSLKDAFSLSRKVKVKILGRGELSKKLSIQADAFSGSAADAIEKAGGTAVRI